jgi:hypothetical protein
MDNTAEQKENQETTDDRTAPVQITRRQTLHSPRQPRISFPVMQLMAVSDKKGLDFLLGNFP